MNTDGLVEGVDTVADVLNFSVHSDSVAGEFVVVPDERVGCFV